MRKLTCNQLKGFRTEAMFFSFGPGQNSGSMNLDQLELIYIFIIYHLYVDQIVW